MPLNFGSPIPDLDETLEDECKHLLLNCLWTITSEDASGTVIITCLKWTFNCDFSVRVTAHPQEAPNVSKQIDLDNYHAFLRSLTDALNLYEVFPQPHLNTYQLEILEELIEHLDLKFY